MIPIRGRVRGLQQTNAVVEHAKSLLLQAGHGAMTEALEMVSETLRKDYLAGPYPEEIQSRSGSFRATFRRGHRDNIFRVQSQGTKITGTFGSQDKRARILNDGGIIRPKTSQFLAVRSEFTKTAGGVVRQKYRESLRGLPNTFVRPIRGRKAKAAVFERIGRRIIPIAWLVKFVFIKGRHYAEKTVARVGPSLPPIFRRRFDQVTTRLNQTLARIRGR